MPSQYCHCLLEVPHIIARGEQRAGELPDILGRNDCSFVGGHPVEDSEDDLPKSGRRLVCVSLSTETTNSALFNALSCIYMQ
jgi:hypothetical protein